MWQAARWISVDINWHTQKTNWTNKHVLFSPKVKQTRSVGWIRFCLLLVSNQHAIEYQYRTSIIGSVIFSNECGCVLLRVRILSQVVVG